MSTPSPEIAPEPAGESLPVRRALVSVADKTGVAESAAGLAKQGVEVISTGGTLSVLREAGVAETLREHEIEPIDLVCVNLYPFEQTVAGLDVPEEEAIENIDVGGPTMIRAAAKNHRFVAVVVRPEGYDSVLDELEETGELSAATRHWLANEAFAYTARYDAAISRCFASRYEQLPSHWVTRGRRSSISPMGRTRTNGRRCMSSRGSDRTSSRGWRSCTANRSRSTTCSTSTRPGRCSRTSRERAA